MCRYRIEERVIFSRMSIESDVDGQLSISKHVEADFARRVKSASPPTLTTQTLLTNVQTTRFTSNMMTTGTAVAEVNWNL